MKESLSNTLACQSHGLNVLRRKCKAIKVNTYLRLQMGICDPCQGKQRQWDQIRNFSSLTSIPEGVSWMLQRPMMWSMRVKRLHRKQRWVITFGTTPEPWIKPHGDSDRLTPFSVTCFSEEFLLLLFLLQIFPLLLHLLLLLSLLIHYSYHCHHHR